MKPADIILLILILAAVVFGILRAVRKKGSCSCCDGSCACCAGKKAEKD